MKYFYDIHVDRHTYYRIPKHLFTSARYRDMSPMSKILYGLFLDRTTLSLTNEWVDKQGRVYFYFKIKDICSMLCISNKTATKLMKELENNQLLEIVRQGLNKPNILYLGRYELSTEYTGTKPLQILGSVEITHPEV